jgi:hypothetical protein
MSGSVTNFLVECGHRHDADDVVGLRLVAPIDDVALLLVRKDGSRRGGAIRARRQLIGGDHGVIEFNQRLLNLADMRANRAWDNMRGVRDGGRFKLRVAAE